MTPKEIFLECLKPGGRPERQLKQYEGLNFVPFDPIGTYLSAAATPGSMEVNRWGVTIMYPVGAPGRMPHITPENKVIKDITRWREVVHAPDIASNCRTGWDELLKKVSRDDKLLTGFMPTGLFEQCHYMMGFEDTLTNFFEHPKEMHELIEYINDYRLEYAKMLIDNMHPEVILSHDDWGTKEALFMRPDMWRDFFKEPYRRLYQYIRSRGVITIHHADSYLVPIVEDMAEIGIQVWQGVLPENNIPELQKQLGGRMALMGGIGAAIDRVDATEAEIRAHVRSTLETCCPAGNFIPCITYGDPGTVFDFVDPIIDSEIDSYNSELHLPLVYRAAPVHRIKSEKSVSSDAVKSDDCSSDIFEKLSQATARGLQKRVLALCEEALAAGETAQDILSRGLVPGMTRLGEDFSAGRAFVPEMLMAAKCMSSATELLKPHLVAGGSKSIGRVCIGTVKGDMHDIGKNLVKIMMEGSGLEVIDLGVDVSAERFIDSAIENNCDIIACSALLTTSMVEMRGVVELAKQRGIRSRVKIMIGGAPTSQQFCDEIGADTYSPDAAEAARKAVALLAG